MSAYRCMAPARSCRYCCSGPLVSLSSIAILMLSGIGTWLSLSYLAISNSHVVKDSSNLFSLNCGFKSFVRYPTLRVPSGIEKRLCSCLHVSRPTACSVCCLQRTAACPWQMLIVGSVGLC